MELIQSGAAVWEQICPCYGILWFTHTIYGDVVSVENQALSKIGTFYQHESSQARLYHLESLLQSSKWSMHPAECVCCGVIPRAAVEQLSVPHQPFLFKSTPKFKGFFHLVFLFFFFNPLGFQQNPCRNSGERTGRHKIRYILLFGLNVCLSNIIGGEKKCIYSSDIG